MKKVLISTFLFVTVLSGQSFAQTRDEVRARIAKKQFMMEQGIQKYLITFDYNSWFEKLQIANVASGVTQDSQALYYGFGLGLEKNWYHKNWGWGFGGAALAGSATGGDKSGTLTYFQARVPWWGGRLSPRVFYRWTGRTDLGLDLTAFYKHSAYPTNDGTLTVRAGSEVITGAFVDMRVRFSSKFEMIQSFGTLYKDTSIYWRLGMAYRL